MKHSILPIALTLLIAAPKSQAKFFNPIEVAKTINSSRNRVNNIYSGVNFHYIDKEERVEILNSFIKKTKIEYALLPLKEKRLGLSLKKMHEEALQIENNIEDVLLNSNDSRNQDDRDRISYLQAKSNLDFFDRMLKLVAQFKDTHYGLRLKIERPEVYIGINFYRADGKILVGSIQNKLLQLSSKLSGADFSAIKPGDEVLAIDGVNVETKIEDLKPYINSSSDSYADMMAIWSLTARNFKYPEKNYVTITFKNAGIYKLPYFANISSNQSARVDANTYFYKTKIPSDQTTMGMVYDKATKTWRDDFTDFDGYKTRNLYMNLTDVKEYADDNGQPAIRTGYFLKKGKAYGVLQLLTFQTNNVKIGNTVMPFSSAIKNFIKELKENESDLIIDLRNNGGGQIRHTSMLLSLIANTGAVYPGHTSGYRIIPSVRELMATQTFQILPGEIIETDGVKGLSLDEFRDLFQKSIDERSDYTPMFSVSAVTPDPEVGGYDGKIVALISPNCISACDITSFILKASKRATLIGTQANGTGAGFKSSDEIKNDWSDDYNVFTTSVPNFLFGLPGSETNPDIFVFEKDSVERLDTENRPTVADVQYATTRKDILNKNIGWLEKAVEVLETK